MSTHVALIGFGEVGAILADDLAARGVTLSAWDIQFTSPTSTPHANASARPVRIGANAADACDSADIVISAVTAAQTVAAARAVTPGIAASALFVDLNSASPAAKIEASALIEATGARYVEAAVMSPVPPKRIASPILLGGRCAEAALAPLQALGFSGARFFSATLGQASAAKLCRSVMIKGIEALLCESLVTARHYGVEDTVLASLSDLLPGADWPKLSRYMISRAISHGVRRAEEMHEAARTVEASGLAPWMSEACAVRQEWAAQFPNVLRHDELAPMLDAWRAAMAEHQP